MNEPASLTQAIWQALFTTGASAQYERFAGPPIAIAVQRFLRSDAGRSEVQVILDEWVRDALTSGETVPPEVRAYVDAVEAGRVQS